MNLSWDLLNGWQWALLAAVPPAIVLLYFLKLRREPLEVPSTYLWSRTVEDMHVNSIWQRLRRNLLLFLQLLLILLVIIACLNPNWRGSKLEDDRAIFLIDNSASASATDIDGRSRLEEAKRLAKKLISSELKSGDKGMIIAFSDADGARTIQSYTDNKRTLMSKLDTIQPTHRRTNLRQALRFAAGLANPGRSSFGGETDVAAADANPATLFILSDGRVEASPQFSIGNLTPIYVKLGSDQAQNVAITAFQTAKSSDDASQMQVYAGLKNYGSQDQQVELSLFLDDQLVDASALELKANAEGGREFSLTAVDTGVLRLEMKVQDDLDVDNTAYAVLDAIQRSNILIVTEENIFLTGAFTTDKMAKNSDVKITKPDYLQTEEYKNEAADGTYDLVIFDRCAPSEPSLMPLSNTVFFHAIPPGNEQNETTRWSIAGEVSGPTIIDVDQSHPVMQFVSLGKVLIGDAAVLNPPSAAISLMDSDQGCLAAIAARDSVQDLVIGFGLLGQGEDGSQYYNTTWVRNDPSYPVFIQNVANYLGGVSEADQQLIYRPGQLIEVRLDTPSKELRMVTPDGKTQQVGRGRTGAFAFSTADRVGIYELTDAARSDQVHRIAVNLFDDTESRIQPVNEIPLDEGVAISSDNRAVERTRKESWKWLTLLCLAVLLAEWYIYNRRVYL